MKLKTAPHRLRRFASRWLLPPPKPLPNGFQKPALIRRPLVFISQVQRSGGTMLGQLLDGHPQLMAIPAEIHIGKPKSKWPVVQPTQNPSIIFRKLVDPKWIETARLGFSKSDLNPEKLPFRYDVVLHHSIFCSMFKDHRPGSQREVLDLLFISFFEAWDREKAYLPDNREPLYFCAFAARMASDEGSVTRYFSDYPDGHLISLIRNPKNWLPSELKRRKARGRSTDMDLTLAPWQRSAEAMLRNMNNFPGRVTIIDFASLIRQTGDVMERLSERLGINFEPSLLTPTFDGKPLASNSSFRAVKGFVDTSVLLRNEGDDMPGMGRYMELYEQVQAASFACTPPAGLTLSSANSNAKARLTANVSIGVV